MAFPTANFVAANVVIPRYAFVNFIPIVAGVPGTAVPIKIKDIKYGQSYETTGRKIPDADGLLRYDVLEPIEANQDFTIESDEIKSNVMFGGSTIEGGFTRGTMQIWVVDGRDAAGKCAIKSNIFNATWLLDGGFGLTAGEVAKSSIKCTALEKVVLTPDATP